ncbi:MAG: Uma2 family endonuclease [Treponema sp.]|jgi:hypothetical protein|nr:Uma2 family endonuclease [Treponema sp.]
MYRRTYVFSRRLAIRGRARYTGFGGSAVSLAEKKPERKYYTYRDYRDWDADDRAEIVDGQVYVMSPPSRRHRKVSQRLSLKIGGFLEGKTGEVYYAPFAVRLFPKSDNPKRPGIGAAGLQN